MRPDPYKGSCHVGNPQSLNRYSYVQNDPINWADPTGLDGGTINLGSVGSVSVSGGFGSGQNIVTGFGGAGVIGKGEVDQLLGDGESVDLPIGELDWKTKIIQLLGYKLSDCEKKVAEDWSYKDLGGVLQAKSLAEQHTENLANPGERNALRHCIWSCLMTKFLGEEKAKTWGDAHECTSQFGNSTDSQIDLHNNEIGREIGTSDVGPLGEKCFQLCNDNQELRREGS
jgi:hypothetical protein